MESPVQPVKGIPVNANMFTEVGYSNGTRCLFIKMQNGTMMEFDDVPRFRFDGLMAAPRKDAYFRSFIENHFIAKQVSAPGV